MAEACRALEFPVISGNVSLYNETNGQAILPTPAIGGVGIIDNMERRATADALQAGRHARARSATPRAISANASTRAISSSSAAPPPKVDLALEKKNGDFVRALIADGRVRAAHDLPMAAWASPPPKWRSAPNVGVSLGYQGDLDDARVPLRRRSGALSDRAAAEQARRPRQARPRRWRRVPRRRRSRRARDQLSRRAGDRERVSLEDLRKAHESWLPAYMKVAH